MDYSPYGAGYDSLVTDDTPVGKYAPIGPWKYVGYQILFAIPVIGLIFLLIFTFSSGNINRRNYARSYWCGLLIGLVILAGCAALLVFTGAAQNIEEAVRTVLASM